MLRVYKAKDQKGLDEFISNSMTFWNQGDKGNGQTESTGWMFAQPDCGKVTFPAQFVVVTEPRVKLATIQILH